MNVKTASEIDPFVQDMIAGTNGLMYRPLIGRLDRYPVPKFPLPKCAGKFCLDIGSSWGRWSIAAAQEGYSVIGMDPSLEAIKAARRVARQLGVSRVFYIVADAKYLPFKEGSFDVVFSFSVLQHFSEENVKKTLTEVARVLKSGGISLIQMANRYGLRNLFNQLKKGFKSPKAFDVRYWKPSELVKTFSRLIGSSRLQADSFFCLNAQCGDIDLLPAHFRLVIRLSNLLTRRANEWPRLKHMADSVYVSSIKRGEPH